MCYSFCVIASASMFGFSVHEACGILAPQAGNKEAPPALEGEVLPLGCQRSPYFCVCISFSIALLSVNFF